MKKNVEKEEKEKKSNYKIKLKFIDVTLITVEISQRNE